jgi:hypothetical protein
MVGLTEDGPLVVFDTSSFQVLVSDPSVKLSISHIGNTDYHVDINL